QPEKALKIAGCFLFVLFSGFIYLAYLLPEAVYHISPFIILTGILTFVSFYTKKEILALPLIEWAV
ncbi:MAG: hypothetical protein ACPG5T_07455, partial [Endozoicomonas sp.]